jgi:hypothetical protein
VSAGYLAKCAGKIQHPSKQAAMAARRSLVAAGRWRLQNTNVYSCNQCGCYHTGHVGRSNRGRS